VRSEIAQGLFRSALEQPEEKAGKDFERDRLNEDQDNGDDPVSVFVMLEERRQPFPEEMENKKEISDHQDRIDHQLNREGFEGLGGLLFHLRPMGLHNSSSPAPQLAALIPFSSEFLCTWRLSS
jgi:hypothetical protein